MCIFAITAVEEMRYNISSSPYLRLMCGGDVNGILYPL